MYLLSLFPGLPRIAPPTPRWFRTFAGPEIPFCDTTQDNNTTTMGDSSDVLIVGAGLSGLVSALHLVDAGLAGNKITILEGRERVGGRLKADQGVDVGGAWSWVSAHPDVPALARRFGVSPFRQYDEGVHVIDRGHGKAVTRYTLLYVENCFCGAV